MGKAQEFDLHGHTTSVKWWRRFDAVEMTPSEIVRLAAKMGLDGVAITDHDSVAGLDEALEAGAKHGIIVVPGAEFTPYDKLTFPHILALGLDPDRVRGKKLPFFRDIEETAGWIHENDGLVVAPHPSCAGLRMKIIPASLSSLTLEKNIALFDAIQTHDIEIGFNYTADKIAKKHHKPCIGGSDFHLSEQVGIVRTRLLYDVSTWQEVVEAIRRGQVEPFFSENRTWEELQAFSRAVLVKKRMKQLFGK